MNRGQIIAGLCHNGRHRLAAAAPRVLAAHRVIVAQAFGSRVSGRPRPESDLDVGCYVRGYRDGATLSIADEMADSFVVLVEHAIVPSEWKDRLAAMARFRNRLVHLYSAVRDGMVFDDLQQALGDLSGFARAVAGHDWN